MSRPRRAALRAGSAGSCPGSHPSARPARTSSRAARTGSRTVTGGFPLTAPTMLSQEAGRPAGLGRPGRGAVREQLGDLALRSSRRPAAAPRCARRAPARAGARARRACASSLTGIPSWRTGPLGARLLDLDNHLARAARAPNESASSSSSTGSRQQSCCAANASHSAPGCALEDLLDLPRAPPSPVARTAARSGPRARRPAEGLPELGLERAQRDPAVGALIRPVTDSGAGQGSSPRRGTTPSAR